MTATTYYSVSTIRVLSGLTCSELSDANACALGALADCEVEALTNQKYCCTQTTEYYSVYCPQTVDFKTPNRVLLNHYPILSIDSLCLVDSNNCSYATLCCLSCGCIACYCYNTCDYYVVPSTGLVELTSRTFDFVPRRAKIQYSYGYTTVPSVVSELSSVIAAQMAWANFLGAQYDRAQKYAVPEQCFDKGDFKDRATATLGELARKREELLGMIGMKYRSQIAVTSGSFF